MDQRRNSEGDFERGRRGIIRELGLESTVRPGGSP